MWFVKIKSKEKNKLIKESFKTKQEAFNYIKDKNYSSSNAILINGESELISDNIKENSVLSISTNGTLRRYGVIKDITNYLVIIKKSDGSSVEFTKNRINKEYINGVFNINNQS